MPLTLRGEKPTETITAERLASYPPHIPEGWIWRETDPAERAGLCNDRADTIRQALRQAKPAMKRYLFLAARLDITPDDGSDARRQARDRMIQYRHAVTTAVSSAILYESWGNWAWLDLSPAQRRQYGCDDAWEAPAEQGSLLGIVWGWPLTRQCLGPAFNLKTFLGTIPNIKRGTPYRWDIKDYVDRGWIDMDPDVVVPRSPAEALRIVMTYEKAKAYEQITASHPRHPGDHTDPS